MYSQICHVQSDPVMYSWIRSNTAVESGHAGSVLIVYGLTRSCTGRPGRVLSDPVMYGQTRLCTVRTGHVQSEPVMYGQNRSCTVRSGQKRLIRPPPGEIRLLIANTIFLQCKFDFLLLFFCNLGCF
jgi:hypothetical protein